MSNSFSAAAPIAPGPAEVYASDMAAIAGIRSLPKEKRAEIWRTRFTISGALQREFGTVEAYSGYMEAAAAGKVKHHGHGSPFVRS